MGKIHTIILALLLSALPIGAKMTLASTSAVFALQDPTSGDLVVGDPFLVTVTATYNERMAACAFRLSAAEGQAEITARTVVAGLQYVGTTADNPLGSPLPITLPNAAGIEEVLLNLDAADPPGGPQDGIAPGAAVPLATYTLRAMQPGILRIVLANARAAETQSDAGGTQFDSVTIDPAQVEITLTVRAGPDLNGDGHVDLRDYAALQSCTATAVGGECIASDLDADGDVDAHDVAILQGCLGGPAAPPACGASAAPAPPERGMP